MAPATRSRRQAKPKQNTEPVPYRQRTRSSRTTAMPSSGPTEAISSGPVPIHRDLRSSEHDGSPSVPDDIEDTLDDDELEDYDTQDNDESLPYKCPFSQVRGNKPVCDVTRKDKRGVLTSLDCADLQIRRHLRRIREVTNQNGTVVLTGGDKIHPRNDPLWQDHSVCQLIKHRSRRSPEELKKARAGYNRKFYMKKVDSYKKFKEDLKQKMEAGQLPKEEFESLVREERKKISIGWYNTARVARVAADALSQARADLASAQASGNKLDIAAAQQHLTSVAESMSEMQKMAYQTWNDIAELYPLTDEQHQGAVERDSYGNIKFDNSGHTIPKYCRNEDGEIEVDENDQPIPDWVDPINIPTWDNPSRRDFLTTLSLFLPMTMWDDNPMLSKNVRHVQRLLSSDKSQSNCNTIGAYFPESEKELIFKTFNASWLVVQQFWENADATERKEFKNQWHDQRTRVQDTFLPRSHTHPPVVFHRLLRNAHEQKDIEDSL